MAAGEQASPDALDSLESLCQIYWYPLYVFARRRGQSAQQAEDLTQSFFAEVMEKGYLRSANRERGRFRSFVLTMFKRFMSTESQKLKAAKRGGDTYTLSLDFPAGEQRYLLEPEDRWTAEKLYERRWALTLLDRVLNQLRDAHVAKGNAEFFELAQVFLTAHAGEKRYADVAQELQMSPSALRVAVHRMRGNYRELLKAEVAQTLENPDESENELQHLRSAIRGES